MKTFPVGMKEEDKGGNDERGQEEKRLDCLTTYNLYNNEQLSIGERVLCIITKRFARHWADSSLSIQFHVNVFLLLLLRLGLAYNSRGP